MPKNVDEPEARPVRAPGAGAPPLGAVAPVHLRPALVMLVAAGGAVGAPLRYALSKALPTAHDAFPLATFATNLAGAFALGALLELLARLGPDDGPRRLVRLGVGTGVLGAFTTYSTLAVEVAQLGRDGRPLLGLLYALTSAVLGLVSAAAGVAVAGVGHRRYATPARPPTEQPGAGSEVDADALRFDPARELTDGDGR